MSAASQALIKKLKLKPSQRAAIINAPPEYLAQLKPLPPEVTLSEKLTGTFDWIQIFVLNKAAVDRLAPRAIKALKPESLLWVTFPKGSSKIQTDLTRDQGWDVFQKADLKWINLISVDETWSAFALRPYRPGEKRQSFR